MSESTSLRIFAKFQLTTAARRYSPAPVDNCGAALAAVRELRTEGIVIDYAVGGAMAYAFWSEPTTTFDLDVFVLLETSGMITDMGPIALSPGAT